MTALPAVSTFTGSTVTEAGFKTAVTDQRGFLAGLLGTDGLPATAMRSLGTPFNEVEGLSSTTTITAAQRGSIIHTSGSWVMSLPTVAASGDGFNVSIRNSSGTITINPAGSETIEGASTYALEPNHHVVLYCTGTTWYVLEFAGANAANIVTTGTGANGRWVKFNDGTMICTQSTFTLPIVDTVVGALWRSADITWTYPATFTGEVVTNIITSVADCWTVYNGLPGNSSVTFRVLGYQVRAAGAGARLSAIGRWK